MIYDSPKPAKKKSAVKERVLSPITSITGLSLIGIGVGMIYLNLDSFVSYALIGSGLFLLGVKDNALKSLIKK